MLFADFDILLTPLYKNIKKALTISFVQSLFAFVEIFSQKPMHSIVNSALAAAVLLYGCNFFLGVVCTL